MRASAWLVAGVERPSRRAAQFEASRIAAGDGLIWATIPNSTGVIVYDTATGESARIGTGRGSEGVAFAFGSAWVTNKGEGTVSRVSASP